MNKLIIACVLIVVVGCAPAEEPAEPATDQASATHAPTASAAVTATASATPTPTEETSPVALTPSVTSEYEAVPPAPHPTCPTLEAGTAVYTDATETYCVLLPEGWDTYGSSFASPPVSGGSEPIQVTLGINATGPADGRTLDQVVEESTEWMRNDPNLSVEQTTISLGGETAILFKGVPGLGGDYYQWYVIHNETVYEGSGGPTGDLEAATEVFDTAFELFVRTLTWLDG